MAFVVKDRVRETSATAGTGSITLAGALNGYQSFSVIGNGNTTYYAIVDSVTGDWEVGVGVYTSATTSLSRDTVLESSNGGALVNFAANVKDVFVTYPAEKAVYYDTNDVVNISANSASTALTITQTGAGNALVVEDSTSPDSSPFVIDASGNVGVGTSTLTNGKVTIRSDSSGALSSALVLQNAVASVQDTAVGLYLQPNGASARAASIQSFQTAAGNYADLRFFTANATTPAEAMRITSGGRVVVGGLAARTNLNTSALTPALQVEGTTSDSRSASFTSDGGTSAGGGFNLILARTRGTALGDSTVVASGDSLGEIRFHGSDGTNLIQAAGIECRVDATPGANDMPGNLLFKTTADGTSSSAERMRIDASGKVGIGISPSYKLDVSTGALGDIARFVGSDGAMIVSNPTGGISFNQLNGGYISWQQGGVERLRIDTSGNVNIPTAGARITGDFSNATIANRVMFQTSTVNGNSQVEVIPNGSGTQSNIIVSSSSSDPANTSFGSLLLNGGLEFRIQSGIRGTGTYLPMTFVTGGSERMRIDTSGNVGIGRSPTAKFDVYDASSTVASQFVSGAVALQNYASSAGGLVCVGASSNHPVIFQVNGTNRARLDTDGSFTVTTAAGIGYGTGAGKAYTQSTSRTTAVDCNTPGARPCGSITMFTAAGSTTPSSFTVNNSLVAATDTVILSMSSGSTNTYNYSVKAVGSGSFTIAFWTTGGTASDTPVINFAIIKAVTA